MSTSATALSAPAAQGSAISTIPTTRHCANLFPDCANMTRELPFTESVSAIIRISEDAVYRGETQRCDIRYQNRSLVSGQDMVHVSSPISYYETFVSDLPVDQDVGITIGTSSQCLASTLKTTSKAGIYTVVNRVTSSEWYTVLRKLMSPLQLSQTPVQPQQWNLNEPFALVIGENVINLTRAQGSTFHDFYSLKNTTELLHILFFKIVDNYAEPEADPVRIAVPVVVPPHDQRSLPIQFFHQYHKMHAISHPSYRGGNFFNHSLYSIVDTVATIEP